MTLTWKITKSDIDKLQKFVESNKDNAFVAKRIDTNATLDFHPTNVNAVVKAMLMCLLTSQQRSGPESPVAKFLNQTPFPINTDWIQNNRMNIGESLKEELTKWNLTRYINKISSFFEENINYCLEQNWRVEKTINELKRQNSRKKERIVADKIEEELKGFGPKQSRNFLQALGATKFEIPIDSRIINWLNGFGFPMKLTSKSLADKHYYHFVNDGIIALCEEAKILPCVFDAVIFSSYDHGRWTKENMAF